MERKKEISKAEEIISSIENQVGEARNKTIFRYTVKHSDPEELAQVLHKVYTIMVTEGVAFDDSVIQSEQEKIQKAKAEQEKKR